MPPGSLLAEGLLVAFFNIIYIHIYIYCQKKLYIYIQIIVIIIRSTMIILRTVEIWRLVEKGVAKIVSVRRLTKESRVWASGGRRFI